MRILQDEVGRQQQCVEFAEQHVRFRLQVSKLPDDLTRQRKVLGGDGISVETQKSFVKSFGATAKERTSEYTKLR